MATNLNELKTGREKLEIINQVLARIDTIAQAMDNTRLDEIVGLKERVVNTYEKLSYLANKVNLDLTDTETKVNEIKEIYTEFEVINASIDEIRQVHQDSKIFKVEFALVEKKLNEVKDTFSQLEELKKEINSKYNVVLEVNKLIENAETNLQEFETAVQNAEELKNNMQEFNDLVAGFKTQLNEVSKELNSIEKIVKNELFTKQNEFNKKADDTLANIEELNIKFFKELEQSKEELKTQIDNEKNEFSTNAKTSLTAIENLNSVFLTTFQAKMAELKLKFEELAKKVYGFYFIGEEEPKEAKLNQIWLNTTNAILTTYRPNPAIRFFGSEEPQNFARINDTFYNEKENKLFIFKNTNKGNVWVEINQNTLEADLKQSALPDNVENLEIGTTAFLMNYLNVFYRENNAFVQISKKLQHVRFTQENEPTQDIKLNDIWKKNNEYFMLVSVSEEGKESQKWINIEEAYKYTKFSSKTEPQASEDITINFHDLWFKNEGQNNLFILVKTENGKEFKDLAEVKANARFKGELMPDELMQDDLWFAHQKDNIYTGELKILSAKNYAFKWLSKEAMIKYARYKSEILPNISSVSRNELCYKPFSKELYVVFEYANVKEWRLIDFNPSKIIFTQENEPKIITTPYVKDTEAEHISDSSQKPTNATTYADKANKTLYFYPKDSSIDKPEFKDTREKYTFNESGVCTFIGNETFSKLHQNFVTSGQEIGDLKVGDTWKKGEEFYFYTRIVSEAEFKVLENSDIKPYIFINENDTRLDFIEMLLSPAKTINKNELIEITQPHQIVNKAYVDEEVIGKVQTLKSADEKLDFENYRHFIVDANVTPQILVGKVGKNSYAKSGTILVYNAGSITTFDPKLQWRISQSGFSGTEVFAYFIHDENWIRIVRS